MTKPLTRQQTKGVSFQRDTWPDVDGYGDAQGRPFLCEVCGVL